MGKDKNITNIGNKSRKKSSKKMASRSIVRKIQVEINSSDERENAMQETNDIPKFDLAEQIMAEHRKNTATKRKGPAKKSKLLKKQHPAQLIARNIMMPRPIVNGPEQVIAEIVARDIENLCIGNTL